VTEAARREYVAAVQRRYAGADRVEKARILTEYCKTTGHHRKAAIRCLRRRPGRRRRAGGPPRRYGPELVAGLERLWEISDRLCGKLLQAALPTLVAALARHGAAVVALEHQAQLLRASPATLDRLLRGARARRGRQPQRAGRPSAVQQQVPIRTWGEWRGVRPGAVQGDLVLHCGESTGGFFLTTLVVVDVATGWVDLEALWGLGVERVGAGVDHVRRRWPVPLREWHTDNGGEFLNAGLLAYARRHGIQVTRGRAYRKNDQAWVEQRNWLAVRRLVGRDRYASRAAFALLQRLYRLLRVQLNFFRPLRKRIGGRRVGSKRRPVYDQACTPYQRLVAAGGLPPAQHHALEEQFLAVHPARLADDIATTLTQLWRLADGSRALAPAHSG
jgi:hypothetical protein